MNSFDSDSSRICAPIFQDVYHRLGVCFDYERLEKGRKNNLNPNMIVNFVVSFYQQILTTEPCQYAGWRAPPVKCYIAIVLWKSLLLA